MYIHIHFRLDYDLGPFSLQYRHLSKDNYRLYNVLCWLWNIYEGAELPSVYFIAKTNIV